MFKMSSKSLGKLNKTRVFFVRCIDDTLNYPINDARCNSRVHFKEPLKAHYAENGIRLSMHDRRLHNCCQQTYALIRGIGYTNPMYGRTCPLQMVLPSI